MPSGPIPTKSDLMRSVSVAKMIETRNQMISKIKSAQNTMEWFSQLEGPGLTQSDLSFSAILALTTINQNNNKLPSLIDQAAWTKLIKETGLWALMDASTRAKWDADMKNGRHPEFTPENISSTFSTLYENRSTMFLKGIENTIRSLPTNKKTNRKSALGNRFIIPLMCYVTPTSRGCIDTNQTALLDDLMRIVTVLDNRPEPDSTTDIFHLINSMIKNNQSQTENDYLKIKLCLNGNAHVTIKRTDLLDQINRLLASQTHNTLPASPDAN